jgi:CRP-like cAMP-binding protein
VWGLAMGGVAVGSIATPVIVNVLGPRAAFAVVGSILPLLTLVAYRRLVQLDRAVLPASELGLIEDVPMFAPLSLAAKERVAKHLVPVAVAAGELVIRAGDLGDRFYIVGEGELDVDVDGRHSSVGPGGYFGEIALLRDVPRTATVTATVDSRLFAVERDDFLAAVTGHSAAHAAGEAVVEERLAVVG